MVNIWAFYRCFRNMDTCRLYTGKIVYKCVNGILICNGNGERKLSLSVAIHGVAGSVNQKSGTPLLKLSDNGV